MPPLGVYTVYFYSTDGAERAWRTRNTDGSESLSPQHEGARGRELGELSRSLAIEALKPEVGGSSAAQEEKSLIVSFEPVYLRCSKLVNLEASWSLVNLSEDFRSYLDLPELSAISRDSRHVQGFLSLFDNPKTWGGLPYRLRIFSSLIDFPRCFCRFMAFLGHSCHFLAFSDFPAVFWLPGTFLPFPGFLGHPWQVGLT
ncbi:hypothetical protein Taro_055918 [Colocasia esculenta]|uniref:Uncharacterized protein n=1 Tax=Colocasia esculenta TaxID=4460 RepID=A0A843XSL1_COLES|nr:hypothetical protein [Colocasia esculenta]